MKGILTGLILGAALAAGIAQVAFVGGGSGSPAQPASAAGSPQILYESTFPMPATLPAPPAGINQLYHYVVEFVPGAQTPTHSHPAGCVATVVEGQVTNHFPTSATVAGPGKNLVTPGGMLGRHSNDSSSNRAIYFASCYAGADGAFATVDASAPAPPIGPNVLFASGMSLAGVPAQYSVVQRVIDFSSGASGDLKSIGAGMVTVLEGQLTVTTGGAQKKLGVGETYVSQPGEVNAALNSGTGLTRVVATYVVTSTAPASAPVSPPNTGDGGLQAALSFSTKGGGSMPGMFFCWMGAQPAS
jgi:quercetin dioxygenase-like cupin family protein